jgi:hypothetical protein
MVEELGLSEEYANYLKMFVNGEEVNDDKAFIKDLGLLEEKVDIEVEVFLGLSVEVFGKGKDYSAML